MKSIDYLLEKYRTERILMKEMARLKKKKKRGKRSKHKTNAINACSTSFNKSNQTKHVAADVVSDAFLSTYEWRRVRMEALKKYGARCQCCVATPADGIVLNVDHIKPRRLYPSLALDINNLQVLCAPCNHGKGNWDMTDWRNSASPLHGLSIA